MSRHGYYGVDDREVAQELVERATAQQLYPSTLGPGRRVLRFEVRAHSWLQQSWFLPRIPDPFAERTWGVYPIWEYCDMPGKEFSGPFVPLKEIR